MIESLHHSDAMTIEMRPFSRVARSVAGYGVATALMLISPLLVFAPASLFHCAMRNGRRASWAAAVVAIVIAGGCVYLAQVATPTAGAESMRLYASFFGIAVSIAISSMVVVPLVERRAKFGTVLAIAIVCSAVCLALTELVMRATASFSPHAVEVAERTKFAVAKANEFQAAASQSMLGRIGLWLLTHSAEVLPATMLVNFALFFVLSLMMYGRLSAWRAFATTRVADSEARRTYLFRNLALPEWMLFVFVIGGLTPALTGIWQNVAANFLTLAVSLYMLQGLSIFRFMLAKAGVGFIGGTLGILLLAMLCVSGGIGVLLLAAAGLFDPFFDFRHLKRKDDSHESHTD